jgi:hypothetical protein
MGKRVCVKVWAKYCVCKPVWDIARLKLFVYKYMLKIVHHIKLYVQKCVNKNVCLKVNVKVFMYVKVFMLKCILKSVCIKVFVYKDMWKRACKKVFMPVKVFM